jgi:DNA-binding MarR family transcriptional regulator
MRSARQVDNDGTNESLKTITLTEQEVRAAARLLNALTGVQGDRGRELTTMANAQVAVPRRQGHAVLQERARQLYVGRARRSQIFNKGMFGEPAWDMLLALYVTDQSGPRHTISGLVNLSGVPATSALRWLNYLEHEQLVSRDPNSTDKRVIHIKLTDMARSLLDAYLFGTVAE